MQIDWIVRSAKSRNCNICILQGGKHWELRVLQAWAKCIHSSDTGKACKYLDIFTESNAIWIHIYNDWKIRGIWVPVCTLSIKDMTGTMYGNQAEFKQKAWDFSSCQIYNDGMQSEWWLAHSAISKVSKSDEKLFYLNVTHKCYVYIIWFCHFLSCNTQRSSLVFVGKVNSDRRMCFFCIVAMWGLGVAWTVEIGIVNRWLSEA